MRVPNYLDTEGAKFWKRHANRLEQAGLLTDADVESFALLCRLWSILQQVDVSGGDRVGVMKFVGLTKQYMSLARQFSLLPRDRKKDNLDTEATTTDEFGL